MPIKDLEQSSWLNGPNASYIESFYESWLKDPASVSEQWRNYFAQMLMEDAGDISREALHSEIVTSLANRPHAGVVCDVSRQDLEIAGKQVFVQQLIAAYRVLGTRRAQLDPLKRHEAPVIPELDPDFYGLTDADLDTEFHITNTYFGAKCRCARCSPPCARHIAARSVPNSCISLIRSKSAGGRKNSSAVVLDRCTRLNVAVRFSKV